MKNEFDNSKMNDGKNRITVPEDVKKSGDGSWRSKLPIFIVILVIIVVYCILVYREGNKNNEKITRAEWNEMLLEDFGRGTEFTDAEQIVTGEDIALSTLSLVDEQRLLALTDEKEINQETIEEIADKYDIVKKRRLRKKYGRKDAKNALNAFLDFYTSEETYLDYQKIELKPDVIDSSDWKISSEAGDYLHSYVECDKKPEVGKITLIDDSTTEYPRALRIVGVQDNGSGYNIQFVEVNDPEEVFEKIYFSGYGHILEDSQIETSSNVDVELTPSEEEASSDNNIFGPMNVYAYEFSEDHAMDIKFNVDYLNENGEQSITNTVTVDGKSLYENGEEFGAEGNHDNWSANGQISGSLELKDFTVLASATIFEGDDNGVEVIVSTDVINSLEFEGNFEGQWELARIPVTICGLRNPLTDKNVGSVTADIYIYLVVSADGEITLTYTLKNAKVGVSATSKDGFQLIKKKPKTKAEIDGDVSIFVGLESEVDLQAQVLNFDALEVANPSVTIGACANGELLEQNEGFEDYPKCVNLEFAAPTLNLNASDNSDTLLAEIMSKLEVETSYDIYTDENAIFQKEWHIEWDLDGERTQLDGGEEVCTHIKTEEIDEKVDIKDEMNKKKEDAKKKVTSLTTTTAYRLEDWTTVQYDQSDDGSIEVSPHFNWLGFMGHYITVRNKETEDIENDDDATIEELFELCLVTIDISDNLETEYENPVKIGDTVTVYLGWPDANATEINETIKDNYSSLELAFESVSFESKVTLE